MLVGALAPVNPVRKPSPARAETLGRGDVQCVEPQPKPWSGPREVRGMRTPRAAPRGPRHRRIMTRRHTPPGDWM